MLELGALGLPGCWGSTVLGCLRVYGSVESLGVYGFRARGFRV